MGSTETDAIACRLLEAFRRADRAYHRMSGGWRLHAAPEYFATVTVARRVAKTDYVTLEQNINDVIELCGGERLETDTDSLSGSGRFDVAVWPPGESVKGIVEVKLGTWFTYANVEGDVARVCAALKRAPGLRWGMCAFHFACWTGVSKPGAERVKERMANIACASRKHAAEIGVACREFFSEPAGVEDWYGWKGGSAASAVLVFERAS